MTLTELEQEIKVSLYKKKTLRTVKLCNNFSDTDNIYQNENIAILHAPVHYFSPLINISYLRYSSHYVWKRNKLYSHPSLSRLLYFCLPLVLNSWRRRLGLDRPLPLAPLANINIQDYLCSLEGILTNN